MLGRKTKPSDRGRDVHRPGLFRFLSPKSDRRNPTAASTPARDGTSTISSPGLEEHGAPTTSAALMQPNSYLATTPTQPVPPVFPQPSSSTSSSPSSPISKAPSMKDSHDDFKACLRVAQRTFRGLSPSMGDMLGRLLGFSDDMKVRDLHLPFEPNSYSTSPSRLGSNSNEHEREVSPCKDGSAGRTFANPVGKLGAERQQ